MLNVSWTTGLFAVAALLFVVIYTTGRWWRRRSSPTLSYLGTVSEHWLTAHRAEH